MKTTAKKILTNDLYENVVTHIGLRKSMRAVKKIADMYNPYYHGYKGCVDAILQYVNSDIECQIAVTDDFGLQMISALKKRGYHNFTILLTDVDEKMCEYIVYYMEHVFSKEDLRDIKIKTIEECRNMKFDLIISNPPYEVGNVITKNIIDNIDFDKFINLMPLSKYKTNELYQYTSIAMRKVIWEGDAQTYPSITYMSKTPYNYGNWEEFILAAALSDDRIKCLRKYLREQMSRLKNTPFVTNNVFFKRGEAIKENEFLANFFTAQDLVYKLGDRRYEKNQSVYYRVNLLGEELMPFDYAKSCNASNNQTAFICWVVRGFKDKNEKLNFAHWWYSSELKGDGNPKHGLTSLLLAALGKERGSSFCEILPIVNWSIEQTDESILKDYGYSDEEIKEVLALAKTVNCPKAGIVNIG